jgi:hypothetical protein
MPDYREDALRLIHLGECRRRPLAHLVIDCLESDG